MSTETQTTAITTAQALAGLLDNDGRRFSPVGNSATLDDLARSVGGRRTFRDGWRTATYRWDFRDGSAIIVAGDGWDFPLSPAEGCFCWEGGRQHQDGCPALCGLPADYTEDQSARDDGAVEVQS